MAEVGDPHAKVGVRPFFAGCPLESVLFLISNWDIAELELIEMVEDATEQQSSSIFACELDPTLRYRPAKLPKKHGANGRWLHLFQGSCFWRRCVSSACVAACHARLSRFEAPFFLWLNLPEVPWSQVVRRVRKGTWNPERPNGQASGQQD